VRGAISHPIRTTGMTRATKELDLAFLVGGQVTWVGVDVGSSVTRGQVLARIDTTSFAAAAAQAKAATEKADRDLDRARALVRSGSVSTATLDDATTGESVAAAAQREADFALQHGVILAPDDGVIDARHVDPGEVVAVGSPAFRLSGRTQGVVVRVELGDRDVLGLEVGRPARVRLDASPEAPLDAHVSQIASAASPGTGTFAVDVHLDDHAAAAWRTGLTAKVEIERTYHPGAVLPIAALVPGEGSEAFVMTVRDDVASKTPVHVLFFEGESVAVAEPLDGVAQVATEGALSLADGAAVTRAP
jgi:RND family efflux transporter MFP subunit